MNKKSRLHLPNPPARPGQKPDFSYVRSVSRRRGAAPGSQRPRARHRIARGGARARARRRRRGGGSLAPASRCAGSAGGPAPHGAHALVRRSHAAHAARRQDLVLHALARRGGGVGCRVHGAASGRHAVSVVPQPGAAHRPRHFARGFDVPAALEHARHVQGTAAAGDVSLEAGQSVLDLRQSRDAISAGRGLGDGGRAQGRGSPRGELDRRGLERRGGLPSCPAVRLGLSGTGDPEHRQQPVGDFHVPGLCGRRAALVRRARSRIRHRRHSRRRQRLPRGLCGHAVGCGARAHRRRPHAHRARNVSRRGSLDQRRSGALPRQGR